MLRFTVEAYGPSAVHEAWAEFMCDEDLEFDPDTPLIQLFMPWFFDRWSPDPSATMVGNQSLHGVIPTAAYLARNGRRLDPLLRRYLESLLTTPFTFFEVMACDPGTGMTLRDVMTQEEHAVTERGLVAGDAAWRLGVRAVGGGGPIDDGRGVQCLCNPPDGESDNHRTAGSDCGRALGNNPSGAAGLGCPFAHAPASEVIAPASNAATTSRPSTGANPNNSGLHSVGIRALRKSSKIRCSTTLLVDSQLRFTK